ncbi:MAG: hypothetical protein WBG71_12540 [Leeuwenhoekiella sp.]
MKNFLKYVAAITAIVIIGCSDEEALIFDGNSGQTLVAFENTTSQLDVVINDEGSLTVNVDVTTISSMDRTFNIVVNMEETEVAAGAYTVPGSVTIPANSYNGSFTINAVDVDVEVAPKKLVLSLVPPAGAVTGSDLVIDVQQVCPLDETKFVGDYMVTVNQPGVFGAGTFGASGTVVTISADGTTRSFDAFYFEDTRFNRTFNFNFSCNEVVVPYTDQAVGCGGNNVNLSTGAPAGANGSYDPSDDTSFTVNLTDNVDSDCGGAPVQASYTFTKV